MPRVFITGIGLQSGLGDLAQTWQALDDGRSAVTVYRPDGADFPEILGAPARAFDLSAYLPDRKMAKYMNQTTALTVAAAGMALEHAGLRHDVCCREMALFISTGLIAFDLSRVTDAMRASITADRALDLKQMGEKGLPLCNPLMPFKMLLNMPLGLVSIVYGIGGENFILYPGADQGGLALETAVQGIQSGRFERALVGGGVQGLSLIPIATLARLGRVARVSQEGRSGWALADAAAFLVLESEQAAAERSARPMAEIGGVTIMGKDGQQSEELAELLRTMIPSHAPDGLLLTGSLDDADDRRMRCACDQAWPEQKLRLLSLDRQLGYAAAAAVPLTCALAANCLLGGTAQNWSGLGAARDMLVFAWAPEEIPVAVHLKRIGAHS